MRMLRLRSISNKFIFFVLLMGTLSIIATGQAIFLGSYLREATEKGEDASSLDRSVQGMSATFWEVRYWEQVSLDTDSPAVDRRLISSIQRLRDTVETLRRERPSDSFVPLLDALSVQITNYEFSLSQLVQRKLEQRLNKTSFESNAQALTAAIAATDNSRLFKQYFALTRLQEAYFSARQEARYQSLRIVLGALKREVNAALPEANELGGLIERYQAYLEDDYRLEQKGKRIAFGFDDIVERSRNILESLSTKTAERFQASVQDISSLRKLQQNLLLASTGLAIVILVVAIRSMQAMIIAPLRRMAAVVNHVKNGDWGQRFSAKRKDDEINSLGYSINEMLDAVSHTRQALQAAQSELEAKVEARTEALTTAVASLEQEVAQRKLAETQMHEAKVRAEQASLAKSDFVANMSHEIRTPMNAIIGNAELALRTELTLRQRKYVGVMLSAGRSLLQIINDILDFSKIEAGKLDLEMRPFRLEELLQDIADLFQDQASHSHLEFFIDVDPKAPPLLVWDSLRLKQVLVNLLSNAFKFTKEGDVALRVVVLEKVEDTVELLFSVRDSGIGISMEAQQRLFQAFSQADSSTTRRFGGTGLGLTISKRIVDLMWGRIWVESAPGMGSEFFFTGRFAVEKNAALDGNGLDVNGLDGERLEGDGLGNMLRLRGTEVLVVEDHPDVARLVARQLGAWGMRPVTTSSSEEGVQAFQDAAAAGRPFDLVVTDWRLPGMDGLAAVEQYKSLVQEHRPRILVISIYGRDDLSRRAAEAGVDAVCHKPILPGALRRAVLEAFGELQSSWGGVSTYAETEEARQAQLAGMRVLLVEDNPTNQQVATELMALVGVTPDFANNGREAVEAVSNTFYDVVLMDCQMPEMDGYEATRAIRELGRKELPIIAMTANAMVGDREKCLAVGMNGYVSKPIETSEFYATLARYAPQLDAGGLAKAQAAKVVSDCNLHTGQAELPILDWDDCMKRFGNQQAVILRIFDSFVNNLDEEVQDWFSALERDDYAAAKRVAHSLKGAAGNMGAKRLEAVSTALEKACTKQDPVRMAELWEDVEVAMLQLRGCRDAIRRDATNERVSNGQAINKDGIKPDGAQLEASSPAASGQPPERQPRPSDVEPQACPVLPMHPHSQNSKDNGEHDMGAAAGSQQGPASVTDQDGTHTSSEDPPALSPGLSDAGPHEETPGTSLEHSPGSLPDSFPSTPQPAGLGENPTPPIASSMDTGSKEQAPLLERVAMSSLPEALLDTLESQLAAFSPVGTSELIAKLRTALAVSGEVKETLDAVEHGIATYDFDAAVAHVQRLKAALPSLPKHAATTTKTLQ